MQFSSGLHFTKRDLRWNSIIVTSYSHVVYANQIFDMIHVIWKVKQQQFF